MNKSIGILFLGVFCIIMSIWMFISLKQYDCSLLTNSGRFWVNECGMFNNQLLFLNALPLIPGFISLYGYFKILRPMDQDDRQSLESEKH